MGCAGSLPSQPQSPSKATRERRRKLVSRETRIIQEEEVDIFINDAYDVLNSDWADLHGAFLTESTETLEVEGEWKRGCSAGGSRNDLELFSRNPQFLLVLGPPEQHPKNDDFYLSNRNFSGIDVSCCLTQTGTAALLHVAFFVYRTDTKERLTAEYFLCMPAEADTGAFVNWRQVHQRFRLPPGLYIIVPAVFQADKEGTFTLTVKAPPPVSLQDVNTCRNQSTDLSLIISSDNSVHEDL